MRLSLMVCFFIAPPAAGAVRRAESLSLAGEHLERSLPPLYNMPMAIKILVENAILRGSPQEGFLQRVATVYVDGEEYRVLAPPMATGDSLEWIEHFSVRQPSKEHFGSEILIADERSASVVHQVAQELERRKLDADIWKWGEHPDARYYAAQICLRGHVQSADGKTEFKRGEHCPQCGEACIDACPQCKAPIRGQDLYPASDYARPSFCYKCGRPYPWMQDRLQTAKELLHHDDKLSVEEREKLWNLLQYVISDPKSDLVPAKKKLIEINLAKAAAATRDFVTELLAKYLAEMSKPY